MPDLTPTQEKMLRAVARSGQQRLTPGELAVKAGCQLATVYKNLQQPDFRALFVETLRHSLTAELPAITSAFVTEARNGSYKHGKLIMELVGMHTDKQELDVGIGPRDFEDAFEDDDSRKDFLERTLKMVGNRDSGADNGGSE